MKVRNIQLVADLMHSENSLGKSIHLIVRGQGGKVFYLLPTKKRMLSLVSYFVCRPQSPSAMSTYDGELILGHNISAISMYEG